jgi:DeoR/GlpR family transcriptional regulator of sugar metabolism
MQRPKGKLLIEEYQKLCNVSKRTATNDFDILDQKNKFEKMGTMGKGTFYIFKREIIGQFGQKMSNNWSKNREENKNA